MPTPEERIVTTGVEKMARMPFESYRMYQENKPSRNVIDKTLPILIWFVWLAATQPPHSIALYQIISTHAYGHAYYIFMLAFLIKSYTTDQSHVFSLSYIKDSYWLSSGSCQDSCRVWDDQGNCLEYTLMSVKLWLRHKIATKVRGDIAVTAVTSKARVWNVVIELFNRWKW